MTKSELILILQNKHPNLPHSLIIRFVDIVFDSFAKTLTQGRKIEIRGLGSFSLKIRKAHIGRDPRTNDPIHIDEKLRVIFKPGKKLQEAINL